jgi:serine/threonine-protein kinase RsbW
MVRFVADIVAEPDAISALTERAQEFLAASGVDARAAHHVALVLDELLTNAASYNTNEKIAAAVQRFVQHDRVEAEVVDRGAEFDPRRRRNIDIAAGISDRRIGGLGLLLVQRVTEDLDYERIGDRNCTTFRIRRTPAA